MVDGVDALKEFEVAVRVQKRISVSIEMYWPSRSTPTRQGGHVVGVDPSLNSPALNVRLHSSHST